MNDGGKKNDHDDQEEVLPQFDHEEDPSDGDLVDMEMEMELDQDGLDAVFDGEDGDDIVFTFDGDFDDDDDE